MQLRYLKNASVYKITRQKQDNGTYKEVYTLCNNYSVQEQELDDNISVSMYGADINQMIRIKSSQGKLERNLKPLMTSDNNNISKYIIVIDNVKYSVVSVKSYIDIKLIGTFEVLSL